MSAEITIAKRSFFVRIYPPKDRPIVNVYPEDSSDVFGGSPWNAGVAIAHHTGCRPYSLKKEDSLPEEIRKGIKAGFDDVVKGKI